jgi:hypothetical protein
MKMLDPNVKLTVWAYAGDKHGPYVPGLGEAAAREADQYDCYYETLYEARAYWRNVECMTESEAIARYANEKAMGVWERMDVAERRASVA